MKIQILQEKYRNSSSRSLIPVISFGRFSRCRDRVTPIASPSPGRQVGSRSSIIWMLLRPPAIAPSPSRALLCDGEKPAIKHPETLAGRGGKNGAIVVVRHPDSGDDDVLDSRDVR